MNSEKELTIQTEEYGTLKGEIISMEELDRRAKERVLYIKFLGLYEHDSIRYMAFFNQKVTVFVVVTDLL